MIVIRDYSSGEYDFAGWVRKILGVSDLALLHDSLPERRNKKSDQDSQAHLLFYSLFDQLSEHYVRFLRAEILPLFTEPVCVQRIPTFRVSQPGGVAVSAYHRDSEYHHQPGTVNFWVPLTDAYGTNAIWVESEPDRGDYHPIKLQHGQILQFDAVRLRHGNPQNDTGRTRVSFDLRAIPVSQFRSAGLRTVTNKVPLDIGEYYMVLENDPRRD